MHANQVKLNLFRQAAISLAVAAVSLSVQAQDTVLEEVVVTGIRGSIASSLRAKRLETRVVDSITAEDIGDFPDENIAESIQRISGVQIRRENGRGALISIRGLGPEFAAATLNGQTFASAEFDRGFRFDIVQSDVASSIEVFKSPSAELSEGGLSGTININTAKPLDHDGQKFVISAQAAKSSDRDKTTPNGSVTYSDQFNDDTVGFLFNAAYQELDTRFDLLFNQRFLDVDDDNDGLGDIVNGIPVEQPSRPRFRREDTTTERLLFNTALQFRPTDSFEANIATVIALDDRDRNFQQYAAAINGSPITELGRVGSTLSNFSVASHNVGINHTFQIEKRNSIAVTGDLNWTFDNWDATTILHYTTGELEIVERAIVLNAPGSTEVNFNDASNPIITPLISVSDPAFLASNLLTRRDIAGKIETFETDEVAFEAKAKRRLDDIEFLSPFFSSVQFGIKYSEQTLSRINNRFDMQFRGDDILTAPFPEIEDAFFTVSDFSDGEFPGLNVNFVQPDVQAFLAAFDASGTVIAPNLQETQVFDINRDIFSAFGQLNFDNDWVRGNIGLRYADTSRNVDTVVFNGGIQVVIGAFIDIGGDAVPASNGFSYDNWLPSANVVFDLTDDVVLRGAAAKVLVRPGIGNTASFGRSVSANDLNGITTVVVSEGSFDLPALEADQFDVSLEWYYSEDAAVTLGYFRKDISNQLRQELVCPSGFDLADVSLANGACVTSDGTNYEIFRTRADNGTLELNGIEFSISQPFTFLPAPWDGFGALVNYTHINADNPNELQPLLDTSEDSGNIILYYENDRFAVRAAYNYRSEFVENDGFVDGSNFGNSSETIPNPGRVVADRNQVDISASYNVTDKFSVSFEALNITDDFEEGYRFVPSRFQTGATFGATYFLGARWEL